MPSTKKLIGALAVTGGVLALGSTAVAFGGSGQQEAPGARADSPVVRDASAQRYTGPEDVYRGPLPSDCTREKPAVGSDQARETASRRVPDARITGVELDRCYGLEWELELRGANAEYEVTVDARDGGVVGYEEDRDD